MWAALVDATDHVAHATTRTNVLETKAYDAHPSSAQRTVLLAQLTREQETLRLARLAKVNAQADVDGALASLTFA